MILTLLLTMNLHASVTLEDCLSHAKEQGDGRGEFHFEKSCYPLLKQEAKKHQHFKSKNTAYGKDNIVFVEIAGKEHLWAGSETGVESVHFIHIDEEAKRLLVIANEPKQILTFDLNLPGNVAPLNRLTDFHTGIATSVAIDGKNKRLLVATEDGKIIIYNQDARDDGRRKENLKKPLYIISGKNTGLANPASIVSDSKNDHYLVLDHGAGKVLYFSSKARGDAKPLKTKGLKNANQYQRFEYDSSKGAVILRNKSGKVFRIK